jgi:hypothetical protein
MPQLLPTHSLWLNLWWVMFKRIRSWPHTHFMEFGRRQLSNLQDRILVRTRRRIFHECWSLDIVILQKVVHTLSL